MKTLKFLHTGDWHLDAAPYNIKKAESSLQQLVEYCENNKVDAIINTGDIWEKAQVDPFYDSDKGNGVKLAIKYLRRLSKLVDFIFIVKGNNSHDPAGSINKLHQLKPNIYAYEYPVCLGIFSDGHAYPDYGVGDLLRMKEILESPEYIISLIPYPTKSSFISEDSIDNNNANFIEKFEQIFDQIGDITQPYTCPKLLAFHGNVVGSRLSSGQSLVSQDIMVAPSTLQKANADYYALGHIHLRQEVAPNMVYSGSIYNKNWGETEQKSFEVVEFNTSETQSSYKLSDHNPYHLDSARPMITVEAEFKNGNFTGFDPIQPNSEIRLRCKINENERNLITDEKIAGLKGYFGEDVKIELNIVPTERESRSEQIMNCRTLIDEVKEYASVINEQINGTIETKVAQLQESL